MRSKTILLCVCAALIAMVSIAGTFAYLIAEDTTENTFTVGKVKIKLDEAPVNELGETVAGDRVQFNNYKLIPGRDVYKDPMVTVLKGSEESYVRMILTFHAQDAMNDIVNSAVHGLGGDYTKLLYNWQSSLWIYEGAVTDAIAGTVSLEFRYYKTVETVGATDDLALEPLFEKLIVPATLNGDELEALEAGGFKIVVTAHAIQSYGFEADTANGLSAEDVAWEAFDEQFEADKNAAASDTNTSSAMTQTPTP